MDDEQILDHNRLIIMDRMLVQYRNDLAMSHSNWVEAVAKNQILQGRINELEEQLKNQSGATPTGGSDV